MGLGGVKSDTMVRKYKKKIGIQFMNYTEENVEKALSDIRTKQKSLLQAAEYYGIPKSTLHDKVKGKSTQKQGGQIAIPIQEEKMLADGIAQFAEWGFPLTRYNVLCLVKDYLDRKGVTIKVFKNNLPGTEWFYNFMKRNKCLTERFAQNIKRSRANVTKETVREYFSNLDKNWKTFLQQM